MRNLRKSLHTQCLRYIQAISTYFPKEVKVTQPQGGYVLWIEMDKKINAYKIFQYAMDQKISIAPGQIFSTDARYCNFIRLSFGSPYSEKIDHSLRVLGGLIYNEMNY